MKILFGYFLIKVTISETNCGNGTYNSIFEVCECDASFTPVGYPLNAENDACISCDLLNRGNSLGIGIKYIF